MQYTTREGEAGEAHVNYACPCGCTAGFILQRGARPSDIGECCCGRLLWVGPDAAGQVQARLTAGIDYELDLGEVALPWGEVVHTALAVPRQTLEQERLALKDEGLEPQRESEDDHRHVQRPASSERVKDVVCGMLIDPNAAAGTSTRRAKTYYFCSAACKVKFDADPGRYVKGGGLFSWLRK